MSKFIQVQKIILVIALIMTFCVALPVGLLYLTSTLADKFGTVGIWMEVMLWIWITTTAFLMLEKVDWGD